MAHKDRTLDTLSRNVFMLSRMDFRFLAVFLPALLEEEKGMWWNEQNAKAVSPCLDKLESTQNSRLIASHPMFQGSHCPSTINPDKVIGFSVLQSPNRGMAGVEPADNLLGTNFRAIIKVYCMH